MNCEQDGSLLPPRPLLPHYLPWPHLVPCCPSPSLPFPPPPPPALTFSILFGLPCQTLMSLRNTQLHFPVSRDLKLPHYLTACSKLLQGPPLAMLLPRSLGSGGSSTYLAGPRSLVADIKWHPGVLCPRHVL